MAKYSIEVRTLDQDPTFELFDFCYDFYAEEEEIRKNFEKKFIEHYYFSEIGFETVHRFKFALRARLNKKMPYWKQLYETELRAKEIDFMLNKDYTETFVREVLRTDEETKSENGTSASSNVSDTSGTTTGKMSNINDGVSNVGLSQGYLTGMAEDKSTGKANSNNDTAFENGTDVKGQDTEHESHTTVGKGNIGITSSADLLLGWRETLINLDELIIEDLHDLFMKLY